MPGKEAVLDNQNPRPESIFSSRWGDVLAWLFLLALWAWFHHRVLFGGQTFILVDASGFFYPLWNWGSRWFARGILPLWNPDTGFGVPYLADPQMGGWYLPLRLAYGWLNPQNAFRFLVVFHHLWALAGFYLLARMRGFKPTVALLGALAFGFSFNVVSLIQITAMLFAFSWIPWVFMVAWRLWTQPSPRSFFLFSVVLSQQMVCGYPLFAYLTALAIGAELGLRSISARWQGKEARIRVGRFWLWLALGGTAALVFNLIWILPFVEFLRFSNLAQRLAMPHGVGLRHLASWFNPFFMGHPLHSYKDLDPSVSIYFMGLPVAVLILWGLARRKLEKETGFLFILCLVLSTGTLLGLGEWLKSFFPGWRLVVRSGYLIPLVVFYGAWLSMQAAGAIQTPRLNPRSVDWVWGSLSLGIAALALLLGVPLDLTSFWLGIDFLFLAGISQVWPPKVRANLLVFSLVCSLGPVVESLNYTTECDFYNTPPRLCAVLAKPGRIYHTYPVISQLNSVSGPSVRGAYDFLKEELAPNWPLGVGLEETFDRNSFFQDSYLRWCFGSMEFSKSLARKSLDYLGVRYVIGERSFAPGLPPLSAPGCPVPVAENPHPLPAWFGVERALPEFDWNGDMSRAAQGSFDFKTDCFTSDPALAGNYVPRQVQETPVGPNQVNLLAPGKGRALLVSSGTFFPGWNYSIWERGSIWGHEMPVAEVNHGFQGIRLGEGENLAVLTYRPVSFRLGCFLSFLICGLWAAMIPGIKCAKTHARI